MGHCKECGTIYGEPCLCSENIKDSMLEKMDLQGAELICLIRFGSHLYGTSTENSDTDYKGIFMPTKRMIGLNKIPKSISANTKSSKCNDKNTKDDIDCELYSLHYFIELACKGETVALDMIHVNNKNLIKSSEIWERLILGKHLFYTKNLKSFVGYARKQAIKYSTKGDRLNSAQSFIDIVSNYFESDTLGNISSNDLDSIINLEHVYYDASAGLHNPDIIQVCGKKLQTTAKIGYVRPIIQKYLDDYGARARLAAENKGVDFKAISHSLRAAYQTKEILTTNNLIYPLKQADFLRKVKLGEFHFKDEVLPILENIVDEVEELSKLSNLPEKANREFWNEFILDCVFGENYEN